MSKTTKKCKECMTTKNISHFYKNHKNNDGFTNRCNICTRNQIDKYNRTKDGVVSIMYSTQKRNSKRRGHIPPEYSYLELKHWLFSIPRFHTLYYEWVDSGYNKFKKPSVDRIDPNYGYSFNNMQLMSWMENNIKGWDDVKSGIDTRSCKSVFQYSSKGEFLRKYISIRHAMRETGCDRSNITKCCKGLSKTSGEFRWSFSKLNNI